MAAQARVFTEAIARQDTPRGPDPARGADGAGRRQLSCKAGSYHANARIGVRHPTPVCRRRGLPTRLGCEIVCDTL